MTNICSTEESQHMVRPNRVAFISSVVCLAGLAASAMVSARQVTVPNPYTLWVAAYDLLGNKPT